jgi:hypothetical protein
METRGPELLKSFKRLDEIGFERARRAVAALVLSLFVSLYLMVALNAPPGWGPAIGGLAGCYLIAFLGVAAEWFWGRWFAAGLGWSGVMVAVASLVMMGWTPVLAIYGGLHAIVVVMLMGRKMVARYDMQEAWRQRYGMDEFGVARLRKTVTRAAASLPSLILWALGPKDPGQGMLLAGASIVTALLAVAGLRGVIRMRSWGLLAMAASSLLLITVGDATAAALAPLYTPSWFGGLGLLANLPNAVGVGPALSALLLAAALIPFAGPALRFLSRRA